MPESVIIPTTCVDDQTARAQRASQSNRVSSIVNRVFVTPTVAPCKSACPQQACYAQATLGQQIDAVLFAIITKFLTPDANGLIASISVTINILVEGPPKRGHLVH